MSRQEERERLLTGLVRSLAFTGAAYWLLGDAAGMQLVAVSIGGVLTLTYLVCFAGTWGDLDDGDE